MTLESVDRRTFLGRTATTLMAASGAAAFARAVEGSAGTAAPDPALAELAHSLGGPVFGRSSPRYDRARRLFDTRFDRIRPRAVAYCESEADVRQAILWARRHGVRVAPRAGGHSYGGYSTIADGLVLDVGRLDRVVVDAGARTAAIGAGAQLIDVYSALSAHGLTIPAGSCPTVGVAGLALGGGIGFSSRKLGLTCDSVRSVRIVTADGRLRTCDANQAADLFWACRGGGGGNFGVVTSFVFGTHPVDTVSYFTAEWPWERAREVVAAWQAWAPGEPDDLFSVCSIRAPEGPTPRISVSGQFFGAKDALRAQLRPVLDTVPGGALQLGAGPFLKAAKIWAGCSGTIAQCHLRSRAPAGKLERWTFKGRSDYVTTRLPPPAIDLLVRSVERFHATPALGRASVLLDAHGGAINRVPVGATAFAHRNALFSCQYLAFWNEGDATVTARANLAWLKTLHTRMRPYVSGAAYQNYIDPDLPGWREAYYGPNLPRLVAVKRRYDPVNFFRFAQSIPTRL